MSENNKGMIDSMPSNSAFKLGIFIGVASMFIIGFFILLLGKFDIKGLASNKENTNNNVNSVANNQPTVDVNAQLVNFAKDLKLDTKKFQSCISEKPHDSKIQGMMKDAQTAGAQGTPYSVIIYGEQKIPINGAYPIAELKAEIDAALNKTTKNAVATLSVPAVTDKDWLYGDKNAPLTVIEYSDIDCPFCKRFHTTMQQVVSDYKGQVNWVYRHFPLISLHPDAQLKANATECVGEQGGNDKFWQYLDKLEKN